jgi:hypothetical protein
MQNNKRISYKAVRKQDMKRCYILLFILFFVSYGYFFQGGGWNQNGRIYLTQAIINYGTFTIDEFKEDSPEMEFANSGDWAFYNGHYYCNKSPGLSMLAVPSFALAQGLLKHIIPGQTERQVLFSAYFSNLMTVVPMSALLSLLVFHVFYHFFSAGIGNALILAFGFGFGTLAFPYSTAFYCHQPASFCSFASFVLAMHLRRENLRRKQIIGFCAGTFAGLGVLIEPSCIFLLGAVALYLVWFKESRRYIMLFMAGCIPAVFVQMFYNWVCFGQPLASSYAYSNDAVMWKVQGSLFSVPRVRTILNLLFSPYRGLFFSSPLLLMALPGAVFFFKEKAGRAEALLCAVVSIWFVAFIASFFAWHGGSAPGPRYLLPAYPYLFLMAGFSLIRLPRIFKITGIVSLGINLSITAVGIEIPGAIKNPLIEVIFKNLLRGNVSINPFPISHLSNYTTQYSSAYDFAYVEKWMPNFNSFNLGEILFPNNLTSILPLICFWILWFIIWRRLVSSINVVQ